MNHFESSSLATIRRNELHLEAKHHRLVAEAKKSARRDHTTSEFRTVGPRGTLRLTIDYLLSRASV